MIYEDIERLLPALHGWCELPKAICLVNLVLAQKPKRIVEIGTWGGRSAFPMAIACRQNGGGKVICIDPWNPEASAAGQTSEVDREWWGRQVNHEIVYQHFKYFITELKLGDYIEVNRIKSDDADPPSSIDILHVDGNHGPEAYTDTTRFAVNVNKFGFCILDDIGWIGGHVQRAVDWLLENGFIQLHPIGTGAIFVKMK